MDSCFEFLKLNLVFLSVLVYTIDAQSQTVEIDSLKNAFLNYKTKDTLRVNRLTEYSYKVMDFEIKEAQDYIDEAEKLAIKLKYKKGIARSLYVKAWIELYHSNYSKGIAFAKNALSIYETIHHQEGISYSLNCIGACYHYQGDFPNAIRYYTESAEMDKKRNDIKGVSGGYINIGNIHADQGKYEEALNYYNKAKKLKIKLGDQAGVAKTETNIGSIYGEQSNYPKALECFHKALSIYDKLGDSSRSVNLLLNIGTILQNRGDFNGALKYLNKALTRIKTQKNKNNLAACLNSIGDVYKDQLRRKEALKYYNEALVIYQKIKDKRGVGISLNNIASLQVELKKFTEALKTSKDALSINKEINLNLGICRSYLGIAKGYFGLNDYTKALEYALESKKKAVDLNLIQLQKEASELLSKIYSGSGDYKRALLSYQEFKVLNDSLFNKENIQKITQLEFEHKYRQEIEEANSREMVLSKTVKSTSKDLEKSKRNYLFAIIAFLAVSLVSSGIIFFMKLRNEKEKTQKSVIEQKLLRSQMTPHFIFNSLSVLQGMILNKEEKSSVDYLTRFSKLLRSTLENSRHKTVDLFDELAAIESYMTLQNLAANPPFIHSVSVDPQLKEAHFMIPPMLIQPFVENAFEHAFPNQKVNKEIKVDLILEEGRLVCTIVDNGTGIDTIHQKKRGHKNSLASTITAERLAMLSKDFKMKGSLKIEDRSNLGAQGTLVTLVIPYKL